jgi:hypothetical protein
MEGLSTGEMLMLRADIQIAPAELLGTKTTSTVAYLYKYCVSFD